MDGEEGRDSTVASFAGLFAAATIPGIGLGSIAGLASVCVAMTLAVSIGGAGAAAISGVFIQPRS